jgi:hypothetical protein
MPAQPTLAKLTLQSGEPLYVNPHHVVSIHADLPANERVCALQLVHPSTGWRVRGTPDEIAAALSQ